MGDLITKLGKLAATRCLTILLTSQTATRVRADTGAVLHPSISGTAWDGGISNRIVLYRDWLTLQEGDGSSQGKEVRGARFAGVVKASGVLYSGLGSVVSFTVEKVGQPTGLTVMWANRHSMDFKSLISAQTRRSRVPLPSSPLRR